MPYSPIPLLEDPLLRAMAERGQLRDFAARSMLIREGERGDALYIVLSGQLKVFGSHESGRELVYQLLGPGSYCGELSLDGARRSASVMALCASRCVVVSGHQLRDFLACHPDFALHLICKLIALLRRSTVQIKQLALDDVYGRIIALLNALACEQDGQRQIPYRLTQQDIADRTGASRKMVGRTLQRLQAGGHIRLDGGLIVLQGPLPAGEPGS